MRDPQKFCTEQMDAEGLGHKLLLTPSSDPRRAPTVTASYKMLTLQALSSSLNAGTAKRDCLGRGEAFGCPPAVCPPNGRVHLHILEIRNKFLWFCLWFSGPKP